MPAALILSPSQDFLSVQHKPNAPALRTADKGTSLMPFFLSSSMDVVSHCSFPCYITETRQAVTTNGLTASVT